MKKQSKHNTPEQAPRRRIRQGDNVLVISGANRGLKGAVLRCKDDRVVVQGVNFCKKHVKRSEANPKGGIVEFERPIHISNVRFCTPEGKPVKLRVRTDSEGNRELYYLDGEKSVTHRVINQKR